MCVYECCVLSVHLFIKYFLFYCTSGRLSLTVFLWVFLFNTRQSSLPLSAHLYVSPWFGSPLLSCLMPSRYGALVPGRLPAAVPRVRPQPPNLSLVHHGSAIHTQWAICHQHSLGTGSTPLISLSLSLSFSYPLSPLLSTPVLSSLWPRLSSLISIIKQKLVNVSDARWLRHPATGPLAQHERTHKHLRKKTHTHSCLTIYIFIDKQNTISWNKTTNHAQI